MATKIPQGCRLGTSQFMLIHLAFAPFSQQLRGPPSKNVWASLSFMNLRGDQVCCVLVR